MMVTFFGCSCVDGCGAAQSFSQSGSCKVRKKMGEGWINGSGIVMEVECADGVGSGGGVQCC